MKDKPLFTIATVTYNAFDTLPRTLSSVAEQDYPFVEHLIVDGCSKDGTLLLVQRYVEENTSASVPHQIHLLCERDEGLYDAMNKALRQASGDYIVFLNAGDSFPSPSTLSLLAVKAQWEKGDYNSPAILYGQTDLVDLQGRFLRHRRLTAPEVLTSRSFLQGMLVCHQAFYVRTDLAREEMYDLHYKYSADYDWCIRLLRRAEKRRFPILNTHSVVAHYLAEGLTTQHRRKSLLERMRIMAHYYGWTQCLAAHAWFVVRALVKR